MMEKSDNLGPELRVATIEEIRELLHEPSEIPITAWLLAFTGAAAQLARYSITIVWQNYLQNPRGDAQLPGALGLGQARATIIQNAFLFYQYLTPLPFAVVSDLWIGRYKAMLLSMGFLVVGYVVLVLTSLPTALDHGAGLGGLITTMALIGMGGGGISAVIYPFITDQIPDTTPRVKRNKNGELVVIDRKLAIQYVFNGYYWMVNIAALSSIPSTLMEKHIDFWAAYLLPTCIFATSIIPVIFFNKRLVKLPPQGNALPQAAQILLIACKSRFRLSAADPEEQAFRHNKVVPWTSSFVGEIRRGLGACRVLTCFVIFWLCYNQTTNNIVSQAGQMVQRGVSNDTIQAFNPLACIIMGPIIQSVVFPFLRRHRIPLGPIMRITLGFFFIASGIAYAAGIQQLIYDKGPCFRYALECPAATEESRKLPNNISVWLQTPLHALLAIGEILALVALNEFTYSEAPKDTKSVLQAFQVLSAAAGSALGMALGPVSKNPFLVVLFSCLAGTMTLTMIPFWIFFRRFDTGDSDTSSHQNSDD